MTKLILTFSFILVSCLASAQVDPSIDWKILRLPHFDLVYDAKHQELANQYADRLEDNLSFLSTYFEFFPERTVVVIDDRTDLTNGYATAIPYRLIVLYPVMPGAQETISDFGDWTRELSMHEFTHILSFEPRRGVVKGLKYIFGNVITPNLLLPRWWLEGIAVDMETRTGDKGRLRSPYQDGAIRAYVFEDKLNDVKLAEINETSIHTWPQGARPYLFGSLMWSDLIAKYGQGLIKDLHNRYGGRVPFFMEGPIQDETSQGYSAHLENLKEDLTRRAQAQKSELQKAPITMGPSLKVKNGVENFYPVISPDGLKMAFMSKDDANKRSVRILRRPSIQVPFDGSQEQAEIDQRFGENLPELNPDPRKMQGGLDESESEEDAPPGGTIQRLAWFPDSKRFIFDKLDEVNRFHEVSDLHIFDLSEMKVERLTRNERAREASVSLDGKSAVYVKLGASRTDLALIDMESKSSRILYSAPLQARIATPVFINATDIVFSERYLGREVLRKHSLSTKQTEDVLTGYPDARFPVLTSKGLQFTSTRNGVANVYVADSALKTAKPLTHSLTLISSSAFDDKLQDLYFSELTTDGFQIRQVSLASSQKLPADLPKVGALLADRYPPVHRDVPVIPKPEPENYTIWPYILPHYWLPDLYFSSSGAIVGGSTAGSDPLGKHSYSLAASYDTEPKDLSATFLYTNNTTPAIIQVKGLDYSTRVVNTPLQFRLQLYEINSLWEVTPISTDFHAGVGYSWMGRDFERNLRPENTESHGPSLIMNYSNLNMSGAQISPVTGWTGRLSATEYSSNDSIENESFHLYQVAVQKYFSKWLPRHNAIMIRAQGQYIDKNTGEISAANDAFTVPYAPFANNLSPFYIMRGYLPGQFLGKRLANYTFEYRFPIFYLYHGAGTAPLFIKRLHAALIADGLTVDGFSYNNKTGFYESVDPWQSFWSTGVELKFDLTIGYHFPVTFYLGYYNPSDSRYNEGNRFAMGIQF